MVAPLAEKIGRKIIAEQQVVESVCGGWPDTKPERAHFHAYWPGHRGYSTVSTSQSGWGSRGAPAPAAGQRDEKTLSFDTSSSDLGAVSVSAAYAMPPRSRGLSSSAAASAPSLRAMQMLQIGQNLTSVLNSPSAIDTEFVMPPLPPPPPELAPEALETGKEAMKRYHRFMGPFAKTFEAASRSSAGSGNAAVLVAMGGAAGSSGVRSGSGARRGAQQDQAEKELVHCLNTVPDIYFNPEFSLTDKAFFSELSERKDRMVLQDKLSYYLDLVEVNLLKQICLRSSSVFAALQTIQKLHADVAAACSQIKSIRFNMKRLHQHLVSSFAKVLRDRRRQRNLEQLRAMAALVAQVAGSIPAVQSLLSSADFASALDLIADTKQTLRTELVGVRAVAGLGRKLDKQLLLIEKLVATEFVALALGRSSGGDAKTRASPQLQELPARIAPDIAAQMSQLASNALQMDRLVPLVNALDTAVAKHIKKQTKDIIARGLAKAERRGGAEASNGALSSAASDTAQDRSAKGSVDSKRGGAAPPPTDAGWKDRMAKLDHEGFISILDSFFPQMVSMVRRLGSVQQTIHTARELLRTRRRKLGRGVGSGTGSTGDKGRGAGATAAAASAATTAAATASSGATTPATETKAADAGHAAALNQYKALLNARCMAINQKASQLLLTRPPFTKLVELSGVFRATNGFIIESEQLSGKRFYGLRGTLLQHAKRFLEKFHSKNINELVACLESELWKQADVPRTFQSLVDSGFKRRIESFQTTQAADAKSSRVLFFAVNNGRNGAHSGFLKFGLVRSTMILLKMISRYLECAEALPAVVSDVLNKLISLLQTFNSKSCELVLGAQAIKTAGLKNITVTHLALASQSLGLVASQVPVVRAALAQHLPKKHHVLLDNFTAVQGDYKDHQQEIFKKMVEIIEQLLRQAMGALLASPWAQGKEAPNAKLEKPVRTLMKHTAAMHSRLSGLLDQRQRDDVFRRIAVVFSTVTRKSLSSLFASGDAGLKLKISTQVQHILTRIRGLTGIDDTACKDLEALLVG